MLFIVVILKIPDKWDFILQNLGIFNLDYTKGIMYLKLGMFLITKGA
jgi:hypothetical protein